MKRARHWWRNMINTYWFDASRRVDTVTGEGSGRGYGYQAAWTSEVRHWFTTCHALPSFHERTFIDVGAGKGKVLLVWQEELDRVHAFQPMLGVELDKSLRDKAAHNLALRDVHAPVYKADARTYPYADIGTPLIVYLFNSMPEDGVRRLGEALQPLDTWLVYHNPRHATVLLDAGWFPVTLKLGVHEKNTGMLLASRWPA